MKKLRLTARFGRPTAQETRQYTTPTRRCTTETKLQRYKICFKWRFVKSYGNGKREVEAWSKKHTMDMGNNYRLSC